MNTPIRKIIDKIGKPVDVINPTGGGGRTFPTEGAPDGTVRMVIEQRGTSRTITDSSGTDHEVDIEFRAVPDDTAPDISGPGEDEGQETILDHPDAGRFRVVRTHVEDADVLVINAVED